MRAVEIYYTCYHLKKGYDGRGSFITNKPEDDWIEEARLNAMAKFGIYEHNIDDWYFKIGLISEIGKEDYAASLQEEKEPDLSKTSDLGKFFEWVWPVFYIMVILGFIGLGINHCGVIK